MSAQVLVGLLMVSLVSAISMGAQTSPTGARLVSLGERIACQTAIEEVYWRHRSAATEDVSKPSFAEAVPQEVIRRNAEDAVLKSLALQRFWGVSITGEQLQAELDRIAVHSKAPDVLRELLAAVGNDPRLAAECLARPLLTDRLLQGYYARDERFHGETKARAVAELTSHSMPPSMRGSSGHYREMEWQRGGVPSQARPGSAVILLQSEAFDEKVKGLRKSLADASGPLPVGKFSALREDDGGFYAVSILKQDNQSLKLATVQWQKVPFDSWWQSTRSQLPMALNAPAFEYQLPNVASGNCRDDSWKPTLQSLDPRYWHTAVWTGTEMIIFGGMSSVGTEYNDGSRYNPATDTWTPITKKGGPSVRTMHVAVWSGSEMVVFGGTGDATGGRYNPVTDTWLPTSTLGAPSGPFDASVVWTGKEMIVWGGMMPGMTNTGARYNPKSDVWKAMPVPALAPRADHVAVWTGTEMVVWGGYNGFIGQMYNDGARYNPKSNTWRQVNSAVAPNARYFHTAVWSGKEMIVWGGVNYPSYDLSGGRYNPATDTWTPTSLANPPSLRWLHSAVWTGKEMIIQGGTPTNPTGARYNPATDVWNSTNPLNGPTNGQGGSVVWTGKEMILWGGLDDNGLFHSEGARYNPTSDSWLRTTTMNIPAARGLHSAVWTGSEMIVWGGFTGEFPNTGGRYDPATDSWKKTTTLGAPRGRENAAAVWTGTEAIFWGGDPDETTGTGGRYNPVTDSWTLTSRANAPIQRYGHTGVWTGQEMIIFAGMIIDDAGYRYNPFTDSWKTTTTVNSPGGRYLHTAVWTGKEMIVWGGWIFGFDPPPTGGRYNTVTDTWTPTTVNGSPAQRGWPVTAWTGTEMIVWGGEDLNTGAVTNDGGRYNPTTDSWKKTNPLGAPSARVGQGVWTGTEMVLWGGDRDSSGGRYDPASDSWKKTTLASAPKVRGGGRWSTVWTGSQMIVWGGIIETQQGNLYCASGQPNVAPVAANDSYTALAGKQIIVGNLGGVLANDSDANTDFLTTMVVKKTAHGVLKVNSNGSFTYRSAKLFTGMDRFTYQAYDGLASSNVATVNITVR